MYKNQNETGQKACPPKRTQKEKQPRLTMKQLPASEQPYERLEKEGAFSLTNAQLLACLISTGTRGERSVDIAARLLKAASTQCSTGEDELSGLMAMNLTSLRQINGIGRVKAIQLMAMLELARRLSTSRAKPKVQVTRPSSVAEMYYDRIQSLRTERVFVLYVNVKNKVIDEADMGSGTLTASLIDLREIFRRACEKGAFGIIVLHSHPSGNPEPSGPDRAITEKLCQAGQVMEIPLIDHIILGDHTYYSFSEQGFLKHGKQTAPG